MQAWVMKPPHAITAFFLIVVLPVLGLRPAGGQAVVFDAPLQPAQRNLVIYSTLDAPRAATLIFAFQAQFPTYSVTYEDMLAADIAARVMRETDAGESSADFVFSSGMDLQMKLANDGYGQAVETPQDRLWPDWAKWQSTAYALTFEPSVLVYHKPSFSTQPPQSRLALMDWLRGQPLAPLGSGPIGTYDIAASSVGYLHLVRDLEHFDDIWSLVRQMGAAGVQLFPTSQDIISRVADGRLLLGYNILGSYAAEQARSHPDLGLVMLRDFTVVVSRIGLVPRASANPDLGAAFLGFLMGQEGQSLLANHLSLPAIRPDVTAGPSESSLKAELGPQLRPVAVGPGLLAYLDQGKRRRMLAKWTSSLGLPTAP